MSSTLDLPTKYSNSGLVGKGVEYVWGLIKQYYQSLENDEKQTKEKFENNVRKCSEFVKMEQVSHFLAKCRQYNMMTYNAFDRKRPTFLSGNQMLCQDDKNS